MSQPVGQSGPVETMLAADAASRMFGIELLEYGAGWARVQLTVRDDMVNGHGVCHGGDKLTAEARMRARYGRSGIYDVTVTRGEELVAEFRGRSHELEERRP
jgi:acyl-CoA thioesterase